MDPQRLGRFSFLGCDPFMVIRAKGTAITMLERRGTGQWVGRSGKGDPLKALNNLLEQYRLPWEECPVPFAGGAVGYLGYDLCQFIERLPSRAVDDLNLPDLYFGFYDAVMAFDHLLDRSYLISTGLPEQDVERRQRRAEYRLGELERILESSCLEDGPLSATLERPSAPEPLTCNFTYDDYVKSIQRAKEYIFQGEIYQVNLSQRFQTPLPSSPHELALRLRSLNPSPFACYLEFPELAVVSSSPERFLRLHRGCVETRPIKGTRPRGNTEAEDRLLAQELTESEKDRAEHVMIVDLERNDLGRVCETGTVEVEEFMALETYATVFHLTSTVTGRLRRDKTRLDLLRACFPGGSITGAPKIRAMEVIDELEPTKRGVYTGSLGYLSFHGDMDLNIAIRTIIAKKGTAYFQVGGGIIHDSEPEQEYQETLDKAKALVAALQQKVP